MVNSALIAEDHGLRVSQPLPWLHILWSHWRSNPQVDVWVGDVTGDPPVPASSTILSNLRDLFNQGKTAGNKRWELRDPAYDFSEIDRKSLPFPPVNLPWDSSFDLTESLLWRGTLYRPLVANLDVLQNPHRPWFVRGGVTVMYSKTALQTRTPRFRYKDFHLRRGDSFWVIKNFNDYRIKPAHWPFPLLHQRQPSGRSTDELISSFSTRFVEDLISASCLKSLVQDFSESGLDFRTAFSRHLLTRGETAARVFSFSRSLVTSSDLIPSGLDVESVLSALDVVASFAETLNVEEVVDVVSEQVEHFFGVIE